MAEKRIKMKLAFWKKDDLGLGNELALPKTGIPTDDLGLNLPQRQSMPEPERLESFQRPSYQYSQPSNKDLEIVSAKLDALKATLENINQRLAGLERVAYGENERKRGW